MFPTQSSRPFSIKTIGILGSGAIGSNVARLAINGGFQVVVSNSRGPETLKDLVQELGKNCCAGTVEETARCADLVVLSVPLSAYKKLPVDALRGKIVIDTMNYYPTRDGKFPELDEARITSSEMVQDFLKDSIVVKTLHTQDSSHLFTNGRPKDVSSKRTTIPISGDDYQAKKIVTSFLNSIGYNVIDAGTLADSWKVEPGTPIYVWPYAPDVPNDLSDEEQQKYYVDTPAPPISQEEARDLIEHTTQRKFPVGGFLDELPKAWVGLVTEKLSKV